jgi:hypothetical protein
MELRQIERDDPRPPLKQRLEMAARHEAGLARPPSRCIFGRANLAALVPTDVDIVEQRVGAGRRDIRIVGEIAARADAPSAPPPTGNG